MANMNSPQNHAHSGPGDGGQHIKPSTVEVAGKTVIDKDGFILASSLPSLSITETDVVAGQTERLALNAEEGDLAIESDTDTTYVFGGGDPSVNDNWIKILSDPGIHGSTHEKGGSDELTTFGDTVHDSVSTNYTSIIDLAAVVDKGGNDQSVSGGSVTQVTWSNASTNDVSQFDITNDNFSPAHAGDYVARPNLRLTSGSVSSGQAIEMRFYKNGNAVKVYDDIVPATDNYAIRGSYYYAGLTTSDTIDIRIKSPSSVTIDGNSAYTGLSINREG